MRNRLRALSGLALALGLGLGASGSQAAPIPVPPGGFTLVELTAFSTLAPLGPAVIAPGEGPQTLFGAVFVRFPVTAFDDAAGLILHDGGLSFGGGILRLEDFVVDTVAGKLFAAVNGSGVSDFPLFDLVPCTAIGTCPVPGAGSSILTGIGLELTPEGSGALQTFLDASVPAGTPIGIVKQVTIVPEPTTALLLAGGLGGLAWAGSRRRAA